ncbi:hypothetical protein PN488_00960, partial [Nodularia spumigena CS-591/12]|uniref:hypothetical protein n=1 Tax=Nodularia spumigena TaxID=70799 RepID=UPI00232F0390
RMSENFFVLHKTLVDPPKSPLKRGTLINFPPPLLRGVRGDLDKTDTSQTSSKSWSLLSIISSFSIDISTVFSKQLS